MGNCNVKILKTAQSYKLSSANQEKTYRVSNYRVCLLYALVCKGCAYHILFSHIIMKIRHETNCWSWFWVYKSDQKRKNTKNTKKIFFLHIFEKNFFCFFLIFRTVKCVKFFKNGLIWNIRFDLYTLNCPKSWKKGKRKFFKKIEKNFFFVFFKFFHFLMDLCTQNHDQKFVSCHIIMII